MNLDKINIIDIGENNLDIVDMNEFDKIKEVFIVALRKTGISPENMKMFYQRNSDATSVLAIQVTNGLDSDVSNYMINGCKAWNYGDDVNCEVCLHAEAKVAQKSMRLAGLISKDIVEFFKKVENGLLKNNQFDLSLSIMMSLENEKEKEENNVKKLLKRFFKK